MLKVLLSCLLILSSILSAHAMTRQEFIDKHEAAIIELCENFEIKRMANRDNPFAAFMMIPARYECGITSFYALHKVMELMETLDRTSEDWLVFVDLINANIIEEYDTYNFITIHLEFEAYLEGRQG